MDHFVLFKMMLRLPPFGDIQEVEKIETFRTRDPGSKKPRSV